MFYFIGYLIRGDAAAWHVETTKTISAKFGTWKIHEKIPPHITIYRPYETENIEPVKKVIREWLSKNRLGGEFELADYGKFDSSVVFAKPEPDENIANLVLSLRSELKDIPGMPPEDYPVWNPHATLINKITAEEIERIWEWILEFPKPNFKLNFDNVTIFRFGGDRKWEIEEIFNA